MKILISHSKFDAGIARMYRRFIEEYYEERPFEVFLDEHDLPFGSEIKDHLKSEILKSDQVLLILSPAAMLSPWVEFEINTTLKFEKITGRKILLPLVVKQMKLPPRLSGRLYIDCTTEDHQSFNMHKLVRQLASTGSTLPFRTEDFRYNLFFKPLTVNEKLFKPPTPPPTQRDYLTISAPMIGTILLNPTPDRPNFVEVGSEITPGKVVCIIEAMKLFNEIESEISGTIAKILVENLSQVEYAQPLFLVEPANVRI